MLQEGQRFCLKWNNYHSSLTSLLDTLRSRNELVDVTLCCQGRQLRAHRLVLSACSPFFREVLKTHTGDPVFFFKDAEFEDLVAIVEFIYNGQVNVEQSRFTSFLAVAEMLKIKGLAKDVEETQQVEATDLSARSRPESPDLAALLPAAASAAHALAVPAPASVTVRSPPPVVTQQRASPLRSPAASPPPLKRRRAAAAGVPELRRLLVAAPLPPPLPAPVPASPPAPPATAHHEPHQSSEEELDEAVIAHSPDEPAKPPPVSSAVYHQLTAAAVEGNGAAEAGYEPPPPQQQYQPLETVREMAPPPPPPSAAPAQHALSALDAMRDEELHGPGATHDDGKRNGAGDLGADGGNDEALSETMDIQGTSGMVEKKFVCRVCSRTYANLMTFRQHFESHKLSIQCWVCRKLCSRVTNLNAHLRNKHGVVMKQSELRKILKYMETMGVAAVAEAMAAGRLLATEPTAPDPADSYHEGQTDNDDYGPTDLSMTGANASSANASASRSELHPEDYSLPHSYPIQPGANGLRRGGNASLVRTDS